LGVGFVGAALGSQGGDRKVAFGAHVAQLLGGRIEPPPQHGAGQREGESDGACHLHRQRCEQVAEHHFTSFSITFAEATLRSLIATAPAVPSPSAASPPGKAMQYSVRPASVTKAMALPQMT